MRMRTGITEDQIDSLIDDFWGVLCDAARADGREMPDVRLDVEAHLRRRFIAVYQAGRNSVPGVPSVEFAGVTAEQLFAALGRAEHTIEVRR